MRKTFLIVLVVILSTIALLALTLLGPGTAFKGRSETIYIPSKGYSSASVMEELEKKKILSYAGVFNFIAGRSGYWDNIRPGKYTIEQGSSTLDIFRMLKNGRQSPVKLVINKFRTREALSGYIGKQLELDSIDLVRFFNSPDSTRIFGLDTNNIVTMVIPNTYEMYWTITPDKLVRRLYDERNKFWTPERTAKLKETGLSMEQAYILASIIEEETNKHDEKPLIASVYMNRLHKGMTLSADPTVKFALRNFGLKRITIPHIRESSSSPYNTYANKGLPPGPICTPSAKSIDAVLNVAETDYLFFCARADFSGYHSFASNETDHFRNARAYQKALDSLKIK